MFCSLWGGDKVCNNINTRVVKCAGGVSWIEVWVVTSVTILKKIYGYVSNII